MGSVRVSHIGQGRVNLSADSGSLELSDASGELSLSTDSGSVMLERVTGSLQVNVNSGKVTIRQLHLGPGTKSRVIVDSGSIALNRPTSDEGWVLSGRVDTGGLNMQLGGFALERHSEEGGASAFTARQAGQRAARLELRVDTGSIRVQSGR